jgi:acyl-CoA reductase-like NAD-dependent aldehyde dehydrogenase
MRTYHHFINGGEVEPAGRAWLDSIDPYQGKPWARIAKGTAADVDLAVTAAARAMREGPWAKMTATDRG